MKNTRGLTLLEVVTLAALLSTATAVAVPVVLAADRSSNERAAFFSMKTITTAQSDFRSNDRDGNRVNDFWTADVYALYGMIGITGAAITPPNDSGKATSIIKLIEPALAAADGRTDQALYGNVEFGEAFGKAKAGYLFRALHNEWSGAAATTLLNDTDGAGQFYTACHDCDRFAFVAFPVALKQGRFMFVVNEDCVTWRYTLPGTYAATFTGATGASTDSKSTTAGDGLAKELSMTAASGQGTFPAAPDSKGWTQAKPEPEPEWEKLLAGVRPMSECLDRGVSESKDAVVLSAELGVEGETLICSMEIAQGQKLNSLVLDVKQNKVTKRGITNDDRSALAGAAKVTAKAALEAALKKIPGKPLGVVLSMQENEPVFQVRIWVDGEEKSAVVNGKDGSVK